jgi:lipid-binding SYLF domain-containing protein
MRQIFRYITLAAALGMAGIFAASAADDLRAETERTVARFQQANPGLKTYFDTAAGYAVFPGVGKGGFIVGGEYGKGLVYEKGRPIGEAKLKEVSIGAQVGGESFDEVIFFQTPETLQEFKRGKNLVDAQVSGVAAAQGVEQHAKYQNGVAVFVLPRNGLMGQASIGGQKFEFIPLTTGQP